MSWVVFNARGIRFLPDGGGGSSRGKESKDMWLKERGKEGMGCLRDGFHLSTTCIQRSVYPHSERNINLVESLMAGLLSGSGSLLMILQESLQEF